MSATMDSEKVEWFARVVLGLELRPRKHHLDPGKPWPRDWFKPDDLMPVCAEDKLDGITRDLNAVHEPAAGWLRGLNLFLSIEDVGYGSWKATARGETKNGLRQDVIARHDHPAEAIIELCWEVGHG